VLAAAPMALPLPGSVSFLGRNFSFQRSGLNVPSAVKRGPDAPYLLAPDRAPSRLCRRTTGYDPPLSRRMSCTRVACVFRSPFPPRSSMLHAFCRVHRSSTQVRGRGVPYARLSATGLSFRQHIQQEYAGAAFVARGSCKSL